MEKSDMNLSGYRGYDRQSPQEYRQEYREYHVPPQSYRAEQPQGYHSRPQSYRQQPEQPQEYHQPRQRYDDNDPPPAYTETKEDSEAISKALAWVPPPPSSSLTQRYGAYPRLSLPVCIPQIQPDNLISGPMPFFRAYPPSLRPHSVEVQDFMHFLDSVTIALAPAPPFQAAQLVSNGIGFVPHHWAQATSAAVGLVAGIGSAAVSAGRSAAFMKKVNAAYFEPRGLKASIKKDRDLNVTLGRNPDDATMGTTAGATVVPSMTAEAVTLSERRLLALQGQIAPLSFEVPPRAQQQNVMDKLAAKGVDRKILKSRKKGLKQAQKQGVRLSQADLALLGSDASSSDDSSSDSDQSNTKARKAAKKEEKRARKLARKEKKDAKKMARRGGKDAKQVAKLKWIVIESI
ncbi:uncharacterized protein PV06_00246 [Exophiala oligosperma]|uniref:Uncharacterized protein n=2 Tax=Chaetothyriales TaxID=34395 RepID=A0A0D2B5N6_9EURO|nr:uncharacterized protein PV06_00246 [Exophiala oligosperma]KAJ9647534.1 hypothetical protein H2204_000163 [Knufia peltigerae]KIW47556.1 hypothetical protein PV06_00246 [Exophiala oligosperma]